jgi:antagonist of KipI
MSLKITRAGILDTIQDLGRHGYQHQGINPGGAMDRFSASLANALLGKELNAPVIEMHFPAPQILFQQAAVICLTGADFTPSINDKKILLHQPIAIKERSVLQFQKRRSGARCYLSVLQNFVLEGWLNSYSTNLKAEGGGYKGRRLLKDDVLEFDSEFHGNIGKDFESLSWRYQAQETTSNEIGFITGAEWNWLSTKAQTAFLNNDFIITPASDRMGFRLAGEVVEQNIKSDLISSPVNFGTVQLLPSGQLIVLMADHQTTGGYPRIANVISAHLPRLAQMNAGDKIKFAMSTIEASEEKLVAQQKYLRSLQNICGSRLTSPNRGGTANIQQRLL